MPYVSCGDPNLSFTEKLVLKLAGGGDAAIAGADLIELGVPYSDPVADGPTIQKASQRALTGGVTLEKIFEMAARLRAKTPIPLIMMTYYNPIYRFGPEKFISKAQEAGVDGLIIPDLPPEEAGELKQIMDRANMDLIFLIAPTTTAERLKKIAARAGGFIYCVSVTGVTGSRKNISEGLAPFLAGIREHTTLPLAVGFGISSPETAAEVARMADGVIVGSSLIEVIEKNLDLVESEPEKVINEVYSYVLTLKKAVSDGRV